VRRVQLALEDLNAVIETGERRDLSELTAEQASEYLAGLNRCREKRAEVLQALREWDNYLMRQ
jgi:hypothetical protein